MTTPPYCTKTGATRLLCPDDGCPEALVVGGRTIRAGCARDLGWLRVDGPAYPASRAANRSLYEGELPS